MAKICMNSFFKLIVIGGSSGSLEALINIFNLLDPAFNIPILIILHRNIAPNDSLCKVLASKTLLQVKEADEKDIPLPGEVYLAPPDYHLLIEKDGSLSLDDSEKVRFSRPSIDVSFQSAANVYKNKLLAILLSGANADGSEGMQEIKSLGGTLIVQDPGEAMVNTMPLNALAATPVNHILTTGAIAHYLNNLL